ncbi:MAG: hypothetical protein MRJ92_08970 [Nitrospira sp.]|nr:hypothetical protein [Nitrospira sp.]
MDRLDAGPMELVRHSHHGHGRHVLAPVTTDHYIRHTIRAVGTLRANESILIRPEIAGRIRQVWFEGSDCGKDAPGRPGRLGTSGGAAQAAAQLKVSRLTYERLKQLDLDGETVRHETATR